MKRILIIGGGYVGKGAYDMFAKRYNTFCYDPYMTNERKKELNWNFVDTLKEEYDLAVVCVPSNIDEENYVNIEFESGYNFKIYKCNTEIVDQVIRDVNCKYILVKSTIEPGTAERLQQETGKFVCQSPEFMGEGKYHSTYNFHTDMTKTPWVIIGGDYEAASYMFDLMQPIVGPQKHLYYIGKARNAEIAKTMENDYFGKKVIFANEARDITESLNGEWFRIREGWGLDPRVDLMHTSVFKDARGFTGKCLPKDLMARVYVSIVQGNYYPYFSVAMLIKNTMWQPEEMHNKPIKSLEQIMKIKEISLVTTKNGITIEEQINPKIK